MLEIMVKRETVEDFYLQHGQAESGPHEFNVYRREEFACDATTLKPGQRDFYKISLITQGEGTFVYADQSVYIDRPALTLLNSLVPYGWAPATQDQTGYFCVFHEDFISRHMKTESLAKSKAMLMYSGWSLTEIAYSLGFEHTANFHIFFKKHTGQTPGQFREATVSLS